MPATKRGLPLYGENDPAKLDVLLNGQSNQIDVALDDIDWYRIGTIPKRNALPAAVRRIGMEWKDSATGAIYRWNGTVWEDISTGVWTLTTSSVTSLANNAWTAWAFAGGTITTTGASPVSAYTAGAATLATSGVYEVHAQLTFGAGGSVATRAIGATVNGGTENLQSSLDLTNSLANLTLFTTQKFNAGDVIRIRAYQGSGAALNVGDPGGGYKSVFRIRRLGA